MISKFLPTLVAALSVFSLHSFALANAIPVIAPVGDFTLAPPPGDSALTKIVDLSGSYVGNLPTRFARDYNIDVAMDESGKLSVFGNIDGIIPSVGGELNASIGVIRTVNGKPTAFLKAAFNGTRDDVPIVASGSAFAPLEFQDLGGGSVGLSATVSYRVNFGGVPFADRNVPLSFAVPPEIVDGIESDWGLQLDLHKTMINNRERVVGSAQLALPNGETIQFPERVVRYSIRNGYTLAFARGTNLTSGAIDRRSFTLIRGLKFELQNNVWQPVGGTVVYRFLGQKGVAHLLDLLPH